MADFKFSCPGCGQHISCDTGYAGMQINCPTCKQAIVVPHAPAAATPPLRPATPPPPPPAAPPALGTRQSTAAPAVGQRFVGAGAPPPKKSKGVLKILLIAVVALIAAAGGFFGVTFALKHLGGKSQGNPEAQVTAPTATATIEALSILSKVHSAYTNLTSVKADGTVTLFLNLSNITVADVKPDQAANAKNANRHPPGMPRIITNTTELSIRRSGTNSYYFAGEAVSKIDRQTMTNTFAFWKSDKGQFMFMDSHRGRNSTSYRQLADANAPNNNAEQYKKMQELFSDPAQLTKIIKDLGKTTDEPVNGQDCYTLTAKVFGQKVKIWVDKTSYLIPQWQITLGGSISDTDIDDAFSLVAAGFTNVPPAQMETAKAQIKKMTPVVAKIRGTITSTSRNLEMNPTLTADDFNYSVPEGVRLVPLVTPQQRPRRTTASTPASTEVNQRNACINNLRQIDSAKQQWALEKNKKNGDTPTEDDLKPYLGPGPNGAFPTCPSGGKYTIGKVGELPTCSIAGHSLP